MPLLEREEPFRDAIMLNVAIVGLGRWGQNLVNAVQGKSAHIRFVRAVVRNPEPLRGYASKHNIELTTDFAATLADPKIQVIVLATPHSLHAEQIIAVAAADNAASGRISLCCAVSGSRRVCASSGRLSHF